MANYSSKYKEKLENELDILNKSGDLKIEHKRRGGSTGLSIPVGRDVALVKVENGMVHHPSLSFVNKDSYNIIEKIVNDHNDYVQSKLIDYAKRHEGKTISLLNLGVLYDHEKVNIPELEGYLSDNQFIGMFDIPEVKFGTIKSSIISAANKKEINSTTKDIQAVLEKANADIAKIINHNK